MVVGKLHMLHAPQWFFVQWFPPAQQQWCLNVMLPQRQLGIHQLLSTVDRAIAPQPSAGLHQALYIVLPVWLGGLIE